MILYSMMLIFPHNAYLYYTANDIDHKALWHPHRLSYFPILVLILYPITIKTSRKKK